MDSYARKLEQYCKNLSTVFEYFLIIGLSPSSIHKNFEDGVFPPSILFQFPTFNRNEILIPESIPLFCFPWGVKISMCQEPPTFSYLVLTDEKGNKLYCTCMKIMEQCEEIPEETGSTTESKRSNISYSEVFFIPKCIVVVSRLAFFETFEKILKKLNSMCRKKIRLPIEWIISHLVVSIPTPPRGHLSVKYNLDNEIFAFQLPSCNKLPLLDINLGHLFASLSLDNVMKVFTCLALENSVVFLSNDPQKLSACSFSLLSLLFPFHWSLVYVPILPEMLMDYLYSPVSYVYGLSPQCKEEVYIRGSEGLYIVDLDSNVVQSNAQAFKISNQSSAPVTLPNLPTHYSRKLSKKLVSLIESLKDPSFHAFSLVADEIRSAFFQFFVSILKNYKKFMNLSMNHDTGCFDENNFLKSCPDNARPFFKVFLKTQMFANFCETRIRPQNVEEHSENLLFDENILAKENRSKLRYSKHPTPFIIDDSQVIKDQWLVPDLKQLDEEFVYEGCFPEINEKILSDFPIPKSQPPKYAESMDFPLQNSSAVGGKLQSNKECILTCWLDMWAACLWYQDESEHNLRLKELLLTLKKLKEISSFSLTPIYKVLLEASARSDPSLGLPIFSEMSNSQVMVDAATVHLLQRNISLSFKKEQQNVVRNTGNSIFFTNLSCVENTVPNTYRRRVFTKAGDSHIFAKQELCFLIKETCSFCKKYLSIKEIKEGWFNTEENFEAFCIECKHTFQPNLRVRVGLEVGHKTKTSNKEVTIFLSPVALRAMVRFLLEDQKNKFQLDIDLFRISNANIFWNLIWHFNDCGLPFEFMLPYEQEVQDVRNSFVIVGEESLAKKKVDKEVQTDWNLLNIDQAIRRYHQNK